LRSRKFHWVAGVVMAALLLGGFLYGVNAHELRHTFERADPLLLACTVALTVVCYVIRAWRWGDLLQPLVVVRLRDLFSATMVGFASSLVVPRSGELLRPWLVSRRCGIPMSAAFATIVIERLIDLISVLALLALYLFVLPKPQMQVDSAWVDSLRVGGAFAALLALLLLALLLALHANAEATIRAIERLFSRMPSWVSSRVGVLLRSFSEGLAVLRAPGSHLAKIGAQSALLWLLTAWSLHLVQLAFAIELPLHTSLLLIAFVVVGESIPTPGLVGGFHAFYLLALAEVFGVDKTTAAAASIAAHALTTLPVLLCGAALLSHESLKLSQVAAVARRDPAS
jgi:glycosyltransferase 2 family protein